MKLVVRKSNCPLDESKPLMTYICTDNDWEKGNLLCARRGCARRKEVDERGARAEERFRAPAFLAPPRCSFSPSVLQQFLAEKLPRILLRHAGPELGSRANTDARKWPMSFHAVLGLQNSATVRVHTVGSPRLMLVAA